MSTDLITVREELICARRWMERTFQTETGSMLCAIMAMKLWRRLNKLGYDVRIAKAFSCPPYAHCFVILHHENVNYIIDVTAMQFLNREEFRVVFRPLPNRSEHNFWQPVQLFDTAAEALKKLRQSGWFEAQLVQREFLRHYCGAFDALAA